MFKVRYLFILLFLLAVSTSAQNRIVHVLTLEGAINPAAADYIESGLKAAAEANAECLILRLNTPGGLLKSTRVIVTEFLQAEIPVVVYVHPSGAHAASAGVFITMAANIAVMAPGTNIGAAHPVSLQGQQDSTMSEKATNDAAAFIRTISEKRSRNIEWAEDAVRKSLSITETEALELNVVDMIAMNLTDLLEKIDGLEVTTVNGPAILETKDAEVVEVEMNFQQKLLSLLSDPNIAYILFMIGLYGILFELYNPGAIFPGVVGVISLILAFYSLHTLPINYAGLALIIFAVILFIMEIKIVSHGLLTIGGVISLVLGSLMLIDVESTLEFVEISWEVIFIVAGLTTLFFVFAIGLGIKAQRRKPATGAKGIIDEIGKTITELNPEGQVNVHGETWNAESLEGSITIGSKIVVKDVANLTLKVRKVE